jgi:hypothetical protein
VFALLNRIAALRIPLTLIYVLGILAILLKVKRSIGLQFCVSQASVGCSHGGLPSSPRMTAIGYPIVLETARAEIGGDHTSQLCNCDYRTETDYANCWSERTFFKRLKEKRWSGREDLNAMACRPPIFWRCGLMSQTIRHAGKIKPIFSVSEYFSQILSKANA